MPMPRPRRPPRSSPRAIGWSGNVWAGTPPEARIGRCSEAIASAELEGGQKRGAYYVRGRGFEQIGDLHEAEQDYRAVLRIDPDHAAAKARLEALIAPPAAPAPMPPSGT
jgi:hypothetical protein